MNLTVRQRKYNSLASNTVGKAQEKHDAWKQQVTIWNRQYFKLLACLKYIPLFDYVSSQCFINMNQLLQIPAKSQPYPQFTTYKKKGIKK